MTKQLIKLLYAPNFPKLAFPDRLLQQFRELQINTLGSGRNQIQNWLEIQLVGQVGLIESAIDWLRKQGVEVQVLSA